MFLIFTYFRNWIILYYCYVLYYINIWLLLLYEYVIVHNCIIIIFLISSSKFFLTYRCTCYICCLPLLQSACALVYSSKSLTRCFVFPLNPPRVARYLNRPTTMQLLLPAHFQRTAVLHSLLFYFIYIFFFRIVVALLPIKCYRTSCSYTFTVSGL